MRTAGFSRERWRTGMAKKKGGKLERVLTELRKLRSEVEALAAQQAALLASLSAKKPAALPAKKPAARSARKPAPAAKPKSAAAKRPVLVARDAAAG